MFGVVLTLGLFWGTVCLNGSQDSERLQEKKDDAKIQRTLEQTLSDPVFNEVSIHRTPQLEDEQVVKLSHSGDAQNRKLTYALSLKSRGWINPNAPSLDQGSPLRKRWIEIKKATEDLRKSLNEFMLNATGNRLDRSISERTNTSRVSNEDTGSDRHEGEGSDSVVQKSASQKSSRKVIFSSPALKKSSLNQGSAASDQEMVGAVSRQKSSSSESSVYAGAAVVAARRNYEKTKNKHRSIGFQSAVDQKDIEVQVENTDAECAVCKDPMHFGEKSFSQLPCGHFFHNTCWVPWIGNAALNGNNQTCPTCRGEVQHLYPRMVSLVDTYKAEEIIQREKQRYENVWHAWEEILRNVRVVVNRLTLREDRQLSEEDENIELATELSLAAVSKKNMFTLWQQVRQKWKAIEGQIGETRRQEWLERERTYNDLVSELEGVVRFGRDLERNTQVLTQNGSDNIIQQWVSCEGRWKQALQRLENVIKSALERANNLATRFSGQDQGQGIQEQQNGVQRVVPVRVEAQQRRDVSDFDNALRQDWQEIVNVWMPNQLQDRTEWTGVEGEAGPLYQNALSSYRTWNDSVRRLGQVEAARRYNEAQSTWSNFIRRAYNRGMVLRMERAQQAIQQDMQRESDRRNGQEVQLAVVQSPALIRTELPSLGAVLRRREIRPTGTPGVTEVIEVTETVNAVTVRERNHTQSENNNEEDI